MCDRDDECKGDEDEPEAGDHKTVSHVDVIFDGSGNVTVGQ
ncbi:protein of unknown function [Xenorhabdus poinarii G6]|uniref:Uncharacterized protein n=1 Tax=Xenorhabdus poinarii G6 TaxID=1354304 RepID=A0A068R8K5_9GAMM|nr:protein of unknown function [Xenorhabdus poinarii G6]